MIILHDGTSGDLSHVQAMASLDEGFALFDYVRVEQQHGNAWIGQIVEPNRNVSTVNSNRLDPTILHGLRLMQNHPNVQSVESVQVFEIKILGEYNGRQLLTPRLRPLPGAIVTRLDASVTSQVIGIPQIEQREDNTSNVIGELMNAADVPLCINVNKFNYHIMVAGGTGSGKSNVSANLIDQALKFSKCVLLHDAKPDYGLVDRANTDQNVTDIWQLFEQYGLQPHSANNLIRVAKDYAEYLTLMQEVIKAMSISLNPAGRLCIFLPKWSGLRPENPNHDIPVDVNSFAINEGLIWIDAAFVSRGRQQEPASAVKNNAAKRARRMRSDTCVLNVFEKPGVENVEYI